MRRIIRIIIHLGVSILTRLTIVGLENITSYAGGLIVTSNHLGVMDIFLIHHVIPREDIIIMLAEKYQKVAFFRWVARQMDVIFIDRFHADFPALRKVYRRLEKGGILVMAPEGTRSKTSSLLPGRPGAAFLASKLGVPVVPVGLTGTEDEAVLAHWRRLRRAPIHAVIGPPFRLAKLPKQHREQALQQLTDEIMCRIAVLLPPSYRGVYADHPRLKELMQNELLPSRSVSGDSAGI